MSAPARAARGRRLRVAVAATVLVCLVASGCRSVGYVARGGLAEARILWRRQPIAELLERPDLDPKLRERLELVRRVRAYAGGDLGLRVGESYTTFADVDGEAVVWVLSAARRDKLEAYTWWWPVVGRVPYQGYFEKEDALAAATTLGAQGFDTDVRSASAFSTLGWFADPLLSTTARYGPVTLTETVIHELFHATLYVPSQVDFNESAASFVGHRGAMAFFCDGPARDATRCEEARRRWAFTRAHGRFLERYVKRLRVLYATNPPPAVRDAWRERLAARAAKAIRARGLGTGDDLSPPNNARLLAMVAYETDLGAFERLAPTGGALPEAIERIVAAARGASDPFAAVRALEPPSLQTRTAGLDSPQP